VKKADDSLTPILSSLFFGPDEKEAIEIKLKHHQRETNKMETAYSRNFNKIFFGLRN